MTDSTVPQNGHVSQEQYGQLFLTIQQGQETLQWPLTGKPGEGDPANHVQQVAVLVVGLDWLGNVLAVAPHRTPSGLQVIPDHGLGEPAEMTDEELKERVAWFLLDSLSGRQIFPQGKETYITGAYNLDAELVLDYLAVKSDEPDKYIDLFWVMLLKGFLCPDQVRRFLAALASAYDWEKEDDESG